MHMTTRVSRLLVGGHWLVQMEWRLAGWSVCLPLLIFPCTVKYRSSLLAPAHPGGPRKRAAKRLWWWLFWKRIYFFTSHTPFRSSNLKQWRELKAVTWHREHQNDPLTSSFLLDPVPDCCGIWRDSFYAGCLTFWLLLLLLWCDLQLFAVWSGWQIVNIYNFIHHYW